MPRQLALIDPPKRRQRRVMARVIDAGNFPDGRHAAHFACRRCGWVQWLAVSSVSAAKKGHPCPNCNPSK